MDIKKLYPGCCFSCGTWFQCCAEQIDFRGIKSYTISQYLIQYGFWNMYYNLPFVSCCFPFPNSKPWLGGSSNKTPEVLTAELIWWQNDSIQFRPRCCLFPCAFGDFPGCEILFWSNVPDNLLWSCLHVFSTSCMTLALRQNRLDHSGEAGLVDVCCETRLIGNSCFICSWLVSGSFCPFPCTSNEVICLWIITEDALLR